MMTIMTMIDDDNLAEIAPMHRKNPTSHVQDMTCPSVRNEGEHVVKRASYEALLSSISSCLSSFHG